MKKPRPVHAARIRGGAFADKVAACRDHKSDAVTTRNPDGVTCTVCVGRFARYPQLRNAMSTLWRGESLAEVG